MKKGIKIIVMGLAIILLAGCMDMKVKMAINANKSVDLAMTAKIDLVKYMEVASSMTGESSMSEAEIKEYLKENSNEIDTSKFMDDENKKKLEEAGYKVNLNMDNENFVYSIDISQNFANIDDISSTTDQTVNINDMFSGETNNIFFTKTANGTYKANLAAETEDTSASEGMSMDMNAMKEYITFEYVVTLPNAPISNNADNVSSDKKTLTWNLLNKNTINFEFAFPKAAPSPTNILSNLDENKTLAIGLIVGGSVTLVVTLIALLISNKKSA